MDQETDEKLRPQTKCTALLESSLSRMPGQLVLQLMRAAKILTDMALSERGTVRGQSYMGKLFSFPHETYIVFIHFSNV